MNSEPLKNIGLTLRKRNGAAKTTRATAKNRKKPQREALEAASGHPGTRQGAEAPDDSCPLRSTLVVANIDVGFGNALFIRGQGDGLSWDKGTPLACMESSVWVWSSETLNQPAVFKLLLNDQRWSHGENLTVRAGEHLEVKPLF